MNQAMKGGEFLIRETKAEEIFIREEFNEEERMIGQTCFDFVAQEVLPVIERVDKMEEGLMASLMHKAGELGILGLSVPEELGGMGSAFRLSILGAEMTGGGYSFSVAYGAHTGIGTLPILYYGNAEQIKKYVPKLGNGEWAASYCLTEPSSGSDANSGKTKATLSADGKHYILNGQKMWITNAGFADVFTVFAKIDNDENLSAFIVEKGTEGLTLNAEEKKLGIKGSSTRQVFLNNVKVPVENLLYERGKGFKIALNILNIGRIKLAAGVLGGSKAALQLSVKYANEREQFGRPIAKYGAIRHKIADQTIGIFALESALYRLAQNIDDAIAGHIAKGLPKSEATLKGIEDFAPECAMLKVLGSEVLDFVVDEGVQIHGGMGYSAESMIERAYRDARINRIFEGTNEINRLLTVDMILKRAMKGELDLMKPAMAVAQELMSVPDFGGASGDIFEESKKVLQGFKKAVLMIAGSAAQKLMQQIAKEQEILMHLADMCIATYTLESIILRVEKLASMRGKEACQTQIAILEAYLYEASDSMHKHGKDAILSFAEGDESRMMLMGLKRFTKSEPINIKEVKRLVAGKAIEKGQYPI
jgi:alkylation response protein AidB-like acyl-CoA dehydrogenase